MIFSGKELKAAVHEAAGIKNARISYDAERRCVIISGDSLRIEIGGVSATEDSWGGAPEDVRYRAIVMPVRVEGVA